MPRAPLTKSALHVASAGGGGALRRTVRVTVRVTLCRFLPRPTYDVTRFFTLTRSMCGAPGRRPHVCWPT
jgi:hypothetical protein